MKISAAPKPKISLSDFHLIKKIGKGSFGEVRAIKANKYAYLSYF